MAGAAAERQETGFVNAVKSGFRRNQKNPITLVVGDTTVEGVIDAKKYTGRQASGSEPYTDVQIVTYDDKVLNLSMKGEAAPSLAGGGLRGLEAIIPGIGKKFMRAAFNHLKNKAKLKAGQKVPDVYGKIGNTDKTKIVVGNAAMGGPIDYMYIGGMDVRSQYNADTSTLTVTNANLIPSKKYANEHDLYFRLRARREDQRFDPNAKDPSGVPKVYGKSPSRGDSAGRIVVTDKVPFNATIVRI